ncbi:putative blastopia polyprotein [Trichonephila clavipes]|nr:putative blastopia polyprotein [Trichonephila clavipes]
MHVCNTSTVSLEKTVLLDKLHKLEESNLEKVDKLVKLEEKQNDFLNSIILDTMLKEPNKSKAQFDKKRKQQHIYKKEEPVTIKRTQFGTRLKLRPNFYGPYLIKTVKPHDRYEVEKLGQHEGPHLTSTAVDFMKRWSTADA